MKHNLGLVLAGLLALTPAVAPAQSEPAPAPAAAPAAPEARPAPALEARPAAVARPAQAAVARPAPAAVPPYEILSMLRSTAFEPIGRPARQGGQYVVRAVDRYGEEVRVVVDAYNGRIRSVNPTGNGPRYAAPAAPTYGPPGFYGPGPRVVRVLPDYDDDEPGYGPGGYPSERRMAPPPRVSPPASRAAAKPPLPRARPSETPAAAPAAPQPAAVQAAPAPAASEPGAGPAPGGATPPPVGFE